MSESELEGSMRRHPSGKRKPTSYETAAQYLVDAQIMHERWRRDPHTWQMLATDEKFRFAFKRAEVALRQLEEATDKLMLLEASEQSSRPDGD